MANEDVIDMAAGRIARCRCRRTDEQCYDCRLFAGLAAALLEARKDRERLNALAKYVRDGGSVHGEDMASNLTDPEDSSELAAIWYGRPSDFYKDRIERVTIEALADAIIDAAAGKE